MALGAVVAAALTDHSAHAWSLWFGSLDIWAMVPRETINVTLSGTLDATSTARFRIIDKLAVLGTGDDMRQRLAQGTEVVIYDHTADKPIFGGWLASASSTVWQSGQGLVHEVSCVGWDACLDWSYVGTHPALQGGSGGASQSAATAIQSVLGNWLNYPLGVLAELSAASAYHPAYGSTSGASLQGPPGWAQAYLQYDLDVSNMSVRSALRAIIEATGPNPASYPDMDPNGYLCFVGADKKLWFSDSYDYGGIALGSGPAPTTFDIASGGSPIVAEQVTLAQDNSELADFAYVVGSNAAGTGYVHSQSVYTHSPVRVYGVNDTTSNTEVIKQAIGRAQLSGRHLDWDVEVVAYKTNTLIYVYMGMNTQITNPRLFDAMQSFIVTAVDLTWPIGGSRPRYRLRGLRQDFTTPNRENKVNTWLKNQLPNLLADLYQRRT